MKWSWSPPNEMEPAGFRWVTMRYRARNISPAGHYALCFLGHKQAGGSDYQVVIAPAELLADGRWHTAWVTAGDVAAQFAQITGIACEVRAASADAELEVADIRLAHALPAGPLADTCPWRAGADFGGFQAIPLGGLANADGTRWLQRVRVTDWPQASRVTVEGIPFELRMESPQLAATAIQDKATLRLAAGVRASEVYLLLLAKFVGAEEPVYGEGRLKAIGDLDRFRLRLEYADGTADECLPWNVAAERFGVTEGAQVLVAAADGGKVLREIVVCDACRQGAFAVAAVTARVDGKRGFVQAAEETEALTWQGGSGQRPNLRAGSGQRPNLPAGSGQRPNLPAGSGQSPNLPGRLNLSGCVGTPRVGGGG
jgi:hypothetical protein